MSLTFARRQAFAAERPLLPLVDSLSSCGDRSPDRSGWGATGMFVSKLAGVWVHPNRDRWLWAGFLAVSVAYFGLHFARHPGGAELYRHAAECLWHEQALQVCELPFTYPPAFAFVMLPFAAMPMWLTLAIWYAITLAFTVWCCRLCEELVVQMFPGDWSASEREWLRFFAILVGLKFILAVYENQSYDLFVLPMTLTGILALTRGRDLFSGISLAGAAALKVTPLIFLPYLLFKQRYTAAVVFVLAFSAFGFLPDLFFHPQGSAHGYFITWVHQVALPGVFENPTATPHDFWSGPNPYNISLRGALALALDGSPYRLEFGFWLRLIQLTFTAVIGAILLASRKKELSYCSISDRR
jgi:glycosyl transferase family 87